MTPLTTLVVDLVEAAGSWRSGSTPKLIESITVFQGFAAVERGQLAIPDREGFKLDQYISRTPSPSMSRRIVRKIKRDLDRHVLWRFR
jgi:hypothetical protein